MVNVIEVENVLGRCYAGIPISRTQMSAAIELAERYRILSLKAVSVEEDPEGLDVCLAFRAADEADGHQFSEALWELQKQFRGQHDA